MHKNLKLWSREARRYQSRFHACDAISYRSVISGHHRLSLQPGLGHIQWIRQPSSLARTASNNIAKCQSSCDTLTAFDYAY